MTQDQQNKPMLVVIALVVLLLIGGAFFFMKKSDTSPKSETTSGNMMENDKSNDEDADDDTTMMEGGKNTLMGLMGMGKNLQCDFDYVTEGKAGSKGTVYVSGKKVRGEFESEVNGKQTMMHMLQDGDYTYVWGTAMPEGIKMKVVAPEGTQDTNTTSPANQYFNPNQEMNFNCQAWGVDASKFAVPSDVTFRDMSAMMKLPTGIKQP